MTDIDDIAKAMLAQMESDMLVGTGFTSSAAPANTTLRLEDFERVIQSVERYKPAFDTVCVLWHHIEKPFIAPMLDGEKILYISRSMWSQISAQLYNHPSMENNFMGGYAGFRVIFEPEPQGKADVEAG